MWVYIVVMIMGLVLVVIGVSKIVSGYKNANNPTNYETLFKKLPKAYVQRYAKLILDTTNDSGIDFANLPKIVISSGTAASSVLKGGVFGSVTKKQEKDLQELFNSEESYYYRVFLPSINQAYNETKGQGGLGFGIITSSAIDMALYKTMDTNLKNRNDNNNQRALARAIERVIVSFVDKIKEIVS